MLYQLSILILLVNYNMTYNLNKICTNCKWFLPYKPSYTINDSGICNYNNNIYEYKNTQTIITDFLKNFKNNQLNEEYIYLNEISNLLIEYDVLNNNCCGEVNELLDIYENEKAKKNLYNKFYKLINYII